MKKLVFMLIGCLLLSLLGGCESQEALQVDGTFSLVTEATEGALLQAAEAFQAELKWAHGLDLPIATEAQGKQLRFVLQDSLKEGQYTLTVTETTITLAARDERVMTLASRKLLRSLPKDLTFTDQTGTVELATAPFLVLSQNIRYADDEGGNMVVQRAPRFQQLVSQYQPDILCMQEDNRIWSMILDKMLVGDYQVYGCFSGGPDTTQGNRQAIYFRADRYELVDSDWFMLSHTPKEPMSKVENCKSVRHCNWALLKDTYTNQELLVCNLHLDTQNNDVRMAQMEIFFQQMGDKLGQYPTLVVGDFNSRPDSPVYSRMTQQFYDPHVTAETKLSTGESTCDKYGTEDHGRIDYLYYSDGITASRYRIMTDLYDGYISDHFGVTVEYAFVKK